jgi:stress response protein YsnF
MNQPRTEDKEQLIRTKAYEIWQSNGARYGDPHSDWYQAQKIVETEQSKTLAIVEKPIETRRQTMNADKIYEPLNTWQKMTFNYWPGFGVTKQQENLIQDSLKFQSKLVQTYVDTQFSFWKNYFDILNSYTSWFSKAQDKTVAIAKKEATALTERKPNYSEVREAANDSIKLYEEQLVAKKNRQQERSFSG